MSEISLKPSSQADRTDYGVAVLVGMAIIAGLDWIFYARKHFEGVHSSDLAGDSMVGHETQPRC